MFKNMQRSLKVSELQQHRIVYCCTNCDKSTLFKNVLKVDNDEKWCGSAGRLFYSSTTLWLDGCIVLNEHNTVLGPKRLAICATVYVDVQR